MDLGQNRAISGTQLGTSHHNVVSIGGRLVGNGHPAFIVAEAGVNHNGQLDLALEMVRQAAKAGAEAIKFQTYATAEFLPPDNVDYPEYKGAELSAEAYRQIAALAREMGIAFFSTPFDPGSADLLERLDVPAYKIASCDLTHVPLLEHVARKGRPMLLSTGAASLEEVAIAVDTIRSVGNNAIIVLQCVAQYPAEPRHVNLRAMAAMGEALGLPTGLSDHTLGTAVPIAAAALGAAVIEKHFTLDRRLPGDDHRFSLEPGELRAIVEGIRQAEEALGRPEKEPMEPEREARVLMRRSIVARVDIPAGATIEAPMLAFLRPGKGIPPAQWKRVVGKRARENVAAGIALSWHLLE